MRYALRLLFSLLILGPLCSSCQLKNLSWENSLERQSHPSPTTSAILPRPLTTPKKIVARARLEAERSVVYDGGYYKIPYPYGDISQDRGACVDVVVRALRAAGYDLQSLIYRDKKARPSRYPKVGGSRRLDPNIDHRRTVNHLAFFRRHALVLTNHLKPETLKHWQPGDLIYIDLGGGLLHCGIVSDIKNEAGIPYLIHNIGPTAREEDVLGYFKIIGHFRYPKSNRSDLPLAPKEKTLGLFAFNY